LRALTPLPTGIPVVIMAYVSLRHRHFHDHGDLSRLSAASAGDLPDLSSTNP